MSKVQGRPMLIGAAALIWLGLCSDAVGQNQPGTIKGTVKDADGQVVPNAEVRIDPAGRTTLTDGTGAFAISEVLPGDITVTASMTGFAAKPVKISLASGQTVSVEIILELKKQEHVTAVISEGPKLTSATENIGVMSVTARELAALPSLGGKDIFRSLQLMPGISGTNESTAGLYLRGGTPDQNLVLLDGATVYNVDHFFGLISAFSGNVIDSVNMSTGAFDAKYGDRLSGVTELSGRRVTGRNLALGAGFSLLSYNGQAEIPISRKATFSVGARHSFQSPLHSRILDNYAESLLPGGESAGYFTVDPKSGFYDVNGRLDWNPSAKDAVFLSLYHGEDNLENPRGLSVAPTSSDGYSGRPFAIRIADDSNWEHSTAAFGWRRLWNNGFSSLFTLAHSRYDRERLGGSVFQFTDEESDSDTNDRNDTTRTTSEDNRIRDYTFRADNIVTAVPRHDLQFGLQWTRQEVRFKFRLDEDVAGLAMANDGTTLAGYLQDTWRPSSRLSVTPGVRVTHYDLLRHTYVDPRLSFVVQLTDRLRFKGAAGQYHQFAQRLAREDSFQGGQGFWTMAEGVHVPESSARHYFGGISYETKDYLFGVEAYRKDLRGLTEFAELGVGRESAGLSAKDAGIDLSGLLYSGTGRAEGVDLLLQKKHGRHSGWIAYSLGRVRYSFPQFGLEPYPASHDSAHEVKVVDSVRIWKLTVSGGWLYASGKPYTEISGTEEIELPNGRLMVVPVMGVKNGARLPSYQRLDISATWDFYRGESTRANAGVSIFNAYNHNNLWRKEYDRVEDGLVETDVKYPGITISAFINVDLVRSTPEQKMGPAWSGADAGSGTTLDGGSRKRGEPSSKVHDFYGTVESMKGEVLRVATKLGVKDFILDRTSLKGESSYDPGTPVHVYYREVGDKHLVAMVFRKM